ncbi:chemotaxis protein MotB [Flexibacter flexilis DSM 6793]|uniref:Chemotaxis protein MotB n=1 Tax=Flexibacter flexilis DSM 6793 TaxID=927664 RepID=A0A1I1K613_9BACT|nr:OmpA family protein [Flexibacter flexilis]SFC53453.1 chemotaxis protein MotB [Flexibacter flexilis DSM 6793]
MKGIGKEFIHKAGYALLFVGLMSACVTRKKYDEVTAQSARLQQDKADCETKLTALQQDKLALDKQMKELAESNDKIKRDSTHAGGILRRTQALLNDVSDKYDKLEKSYTQLLNSTMAETGNLSKELSRREKELYAMDQNLSANRTKLEENQRQLNLLSDNLKEREKRVQELEKILADKDKAVNDLKAKVSGALLNFKEKDLTVSIKNGKVYVSLSEQLLFKSGSFAVDSKGVEALKKLASVLRDNSDINVTVEGHTDDVPLAKSTAGMTDNWDLSVLRATSIVRVLTNEGVRGSSLTAAGHGKFLPVYDGTSAEARQKNRRTEIILTPKLDELFKILSN